MKLRKLRNKLMAAIVALETRYDSEYHGGRLEYAQPEVINVLLNYLKALEYHYRDDVRAKKNPEYNAAMKLFRQVAEPTNHKDSYSPYRLKPGVAK